jgi:dipeptidyl aminopeptidase/acylaminoacyl peptidase
VKRLRFVAQAGFIPDGEHGFYTMSEIDAKLHERHSLWLFDRRGAGKRRVAMELGDITGVAPSPDGRTLAMLADANGKKQIHLIAVAGGKPRVLTSLPQGVGGAPVWSPDGRSIAFTAGPATRRDPSLPYRLDRVTYRFDGLGYVDDVVQNLYLVDVATGRTHQLTSDRTMKGEPRWSPDGHSLLYLLSFRPDREWNFLAELHVITAADGKSHAVIDQWGGVFGAEWCSDGKRLAFVGSRAIPGFFGTQKSDLWTVPIAGGEPECRTAGVLAGVGQMIQTDLPGGELGAQRIRIVGDAAYVKGQVGGDVVIYKVALSGAEAVERVGPKEDSAYLVDVDSQRGILHLATSLVRPPDLMLGSARVTAENDDLLKPLPRPGVHHLEVTAPDGLKTDAWALTPAGGNGPWPTILYVHGGPYGAVGSTFVIDYHLLVGAGFAVIVHNFRGSHGYGAAFSKKIEGNWGKAGSLDHHATVDAAIQAGIADPDRLGVCGLSHGGFATCWLLGTSGRFKAGVAENPVTSFASAYGEMDASGWIALELGGTPDKIPEVYRERSPLTYAPSCKAPLLFVVGEADYRCNPVEAEQYHRVLRVNGIPSEIVRLPNSSHTGSWGGPVPGRIAQNDALVDWFVRYLKPS